MEEIKVKSVESGVSEAISLLKSSISHDSSLALALTGGVFGESFTKALASEDLNLSNISISQTDERFVDSNDESSIQKKIKFIFRKKLLNEDNFLFFDTSEKVSRCFNSMEKALLKKKILKFNFVVLSLGEDGHLAGQFPTSTFLDNGMFCYTLNSPKLPKKRVSFTIEWLYEADLIVLAAIGREKEKSLSYLLRGKSKHSFLTKHKNIYIIKSMN